MVFSGVYEVGRRRLAGGGGGWGVGVRARQYKEEVEKVYSGK